MNSKTQLCKALCLALAGAIAYAGDTGAAPAKPKPKPAPKTTAAKKPDCILTLSCATLHPDSLGDTLTLRPGKDKVAIRAAKNPENFLTMKGVTLGLTYGECGDIDEVNKPMPDDVMMVSPNADGTYNLTLTADGATAPKLRVDSLDAQPPRATHPKDPIEYLSGTYTGTCSIASRTARPTSRSSIASRSSAPPAPLRGRSSRATSTTRHRSIRRPRWQPRAI
jgi:hypothetical protein